MTVKGQELISKWRSHITLSEVSEAFDALVEVAKNSIYFNCEAKWKGEVRDFQFHCKKTNEQPFSFITNQKSLLFYFRNPAVSSQKYSIQKLKALFGGKFKDSPNSGKEWTVKLENEEDVRHLLEIINI